MKIILDGSDAIVGTRAIKRYTINLINEFVLDCKQDQFKIFLNYFRGNSKTIDCKIKDNKNFSKIHFPVPRRLSLPLWEVMRFPYIDIFTGKADIFHALGDDCPPVKHGAYVMTLHGIVYMIRPDLIDPVYVKKKQRWLKNMAERTDYFVSVSENTKNEFLTCFSFIDPKSVKVIPLGIGSEFRIIERDTVKEVLYQKFNISRPYILYVGGIESHKNVEGIIRGFSTLSDKYQDLDLILVGPEGVTSSSIHDVIEILKLNRKIKILKYISQETDDLPVLYNGAECFVFPSFSEGWTSPPLEAMACGTPVVTSNVSSLPETVGNAALLVNPKDYEEIGSAMERLLSNSELKKIMIQRGLQHASKFTWKRCAEETYSFYKHIFES